VLAKQRNKEGKIEREKIDRDGEKDRKKSRRER
jgi:hypothetical protein